MFSVRRCIGPSLLPGKTNFSKISVSPCTRSATHSSYLVILVVRFSSEQSVPRPLLFARNNQRNRNSTCASPLSILCHADIFFGSVPSVPLLSDSKRIVFSNLNQAMPGLTTHAVGNRAAPPFWAPFRRDVPQFQQEEKVNALNNFNVPEKNFSSFHEESMDPPTSPANPCENLFLGFLFRRFGG